MKNRVPQARSRRGAIAVFTAFVMIAVLSMVAFGVDMGFIMVARADLQRSADAAAHAGAMRLTEEGSNYTLISAARQAARDYVASNDVLHSAVTVSPNYFNTDPHGDIVVGKLDFDNPSGPLILGSPDEYNAVRVRVRRTQEQNGEVGLFFGRLLGRTGIELEASATAAVVRNVQGFRIPRSGANLPVLPLGISQTHWEAMLNAQTFDDWSWNSDGTISEGPDGIPEAVLFPNSLTSGNFGTLNIGHDQNSTSMLARQIREGLNSSDLNMYGGELKLDGSGQLSLTGDPGLSTSLKDDIGAVAGVPKIIPLYSQVAGTGNGSSFTVVKWVGVRIMSVNLSGSDKKLVIQPADIKTHGAIPGDVSGSQTSDQIYTPAVLVN